MTPLPSWARSDEAQRLIQAIREEKPDAFWLRRSDMFPGVFPRYKGDAARELRKLHEAALIAAMDAEDREAFREVAGTQPDDLILRLLDADEDALTECVGDPLRRVA